MWLSVVNVKITWGPSSEGIQGRPGINRSHQRKLHPCNLKHCELHLPHLACVEFPLPKAATSYPRLRSAGNLGWMPVDVLNTDLIVQESLLEGVRNRSEVFFLKSIFSHPTFTRFYRMENRGILVLKVCGLMVD